MYLDKRFAPPGQEGQTRPKGAAGWWVHNRFGEVEIRVAGEKFLVAKQFWIFQTHHPGASRYPSWPRIFQDAARQTYQNLKGHTSQREFRMEINSGYGPYKRW